MIKIGITYDPSVNLFFSGSNQTALLLYELISKFNNCRTYFIDYKGCDNQWWLDYPQIDNITLTRIHEIKNLDILIDIDGVINPEYRKKTAKKSIVFIRNFMQFSELDNAVYPEKPYTPKDFTGVHEIWCWDIMNPPETLDSIQLLFNCPIKTVPFIWSPNIVEHFMQQKQLALVEPNNEWRVHVCEKNVDNTSSAVFPIVAIRELSQKGNEIFKNTSHKFLIHNMKRIIENKFLKENILNNVEVEKFPIEFPDKEPYYNLVKPKSILFSHSRFVPLRIGLLNAIWLGIPVIHNSPILKALHPSLNTLFYFGNKVDEISKVFKTLISDTESYTNSLTQIRNNILGKWSIDANLTKWETIFRNVFPVSSSSAPPTSPLQTMTPNKDIYIAFSDMWDGFNYNDNFMLQALRNECKLHNLDINIIGIKYNLTEQIGQQPNLLIFSPFGEQWKTAPKSIPKVYFSGENWNQPSDKSIKLYITSSTTEDSEHIRIPTWMTFIDWFSNSKSLPTNQDDNPILFPLHFAMNPHSINFNERSEFCGFVVSNPICVFRNDCFKALTEYKRVNSGGALFNNIGERLSLKYPGGGCGDVSKYEFFSKHKFTLSFENSQADGYITEKVLHSKMAGCVPIYWGDSNTDNDFVPGSIVNLSHYNNPEQIVEIIKKLEENPDLCGKIASTPILNNEKKDKALSKISSMSKKILSLCGINIPDEKSQLSLPSKIDKIFLINLDSRPDRLKSLMEAEPYLKSITTRVSAANGRTLKMNQEIYNIFENNTFGWKKSVIGCFLSHKTIWNQIMNTPGEYFLVLEDDVRFNKNWLNRWQDYAKNIPKDAELLYLGGVLPPNKVVYESCVENVNEFWGRIKPNPYFSPKALLPVFHFCTYSYIISKKGAEKLLNYLESNIQETTNKNQVSECDHFLGNPALGLIKYVAAPLITSCFQENDQEYINSQFNDINKTKKYDSDIINNTECFIEDDLSSFNKLSHSSPTLYHLFENEKEIYEYKWLSEILPNMKYKAFSENMSENNAWYLVQRPHIEKWKQIFTEFSEKNIKFKVVHLSDEFSADDISFYNYPNCKGVIRNYYRPDLPSLPHIITVPLGYHYNDKINKPLAERQLVWSFHGTNWFDRENQLNHFEEFKPNSCHFSKSWHDPNKTSEKDYLEDLSNSKCCPILRGNNIETFRLYEALEVGTIPIYIRCENDDEFWETISTRLNLINLESPQKAAECIKFVYDNPEIAEKYRSLLCKKWIEWKAEIKSECQRLIET